MTATSDPLNLIAYDGSTNSERAIRAASVLLHTRRALITTIGEFPRGPMGVKQDEDQAERDGQLAAKGVSYAAGLGLDAEAHVDQTGTAIWKQLLACIEHTEASMITIGSRGRGAATSALLGSVADGIVHNAECPVLIVPPGWDPAEGATPDRVIFTVDGSDESTAAIQRAAALLTPRRATVLCVVETLPDPIPLHDEQGVPLTEREQHAELARINEAEIARARVHAEAASKLLAADGWQTDELVELTMGAPWAPIVEESDRPDVCLIVAGSRGLGRLKRMMLGSVSSGIVHHARVPSLIIRK